MRWPWQKEKPPPPSPPKPTLFPCVFCSGQTPNPRAICDTCSGARWWSGDERQFLLSHAFYGLGDSPTPPQDHITLGQGEDGSPITLDAATRNRHLYVIGRTGSGKSSLLRNLIMQDMAAGRGVVFLDPHGDTARQLCGYVPERHLTDTIYFCPTEPTCPAFNVLAVDAPPYKLAADVLSALAMFFGFDAGSAPRMIHLLRQSLLTLLFDRAHEPHALADLRRILVDEDYRRRILDRTTEPDLLTFWRHEYPKFPKDASLPILNKLSGFLTAGSPLARLFSSTENALDLRAVMDGGKILLCNLSKGELGEAAAFLTGGLLTTAIAQAALARASVPEAQRRDVFFYVDEFQNFAIDSFESILSEARKYRLNLTIAHQYLDQVPPKLQAAIFGNVAAMVCLPISAADARVMQREMSSSNQADIAQQNITHRIARLHCIVHRVPSGSPSSPETAPRYDRDLARHLWQKSLALEARALLRQEWTITALAQHFTAIEDLAAEKFSQRWGLWGFLMPTARQRAIEAHVAQFKQSYLESFRHEVEALKNPQQYPNVLIYPTPITTWPEREDFVNLAALHGFVKIGTAKNTKAFSIRHPDKPPNEALARRIISPPPRPKPSTNQPREAAAPKTEQAQRPTSPPSPPPTSAAADAKARPATPPATPSPTDFAAALAEIAAFATDTPWAPTTPKIALAAIEKARTTLDAIVLPERALSIATRLLTQVSNLFDPTSCFKDEDFTRRFTESSHRAREFRKAYEFPRPGAPAPAPEEFHQYIRDIDFLRMTSANPMEAAAYERILENAGDIARRSHLPIPPKPAPMPTPTDLVEAFRAALGASKSTPPEPPRSKTSPQPAVEEKPPAPPPNESDDFLN